MSHANGHAANPPAEVSAQGGLLGWVMWAPTVLCDMAAVPQIWWPMVSHAPSNLCAHVHSYCSFAAYCKTASETYCIHMQLDHDASDGPEILHAIPSDSLYDCMYMLTGMILCSVIVPETHGITGVHLQSCPGPSVSKSTSLDRIMCQRQLWQTWQQSQRQ